MVFMFLGGVTDDTDELFVFETEQFKLFFMQSADVSWSDSLVSTFVRLTEALEGEAFGWFPRGTLLPTHGTLRYSLVLPVLSQAFLTETVAALEHHGVPEDVTAHWAGEVFLWERESVSHFLRVAVCCTGSPRLWLL